MIERIIRASVHNRFFILILMALVVVATAASEVPRLRELEKRFAREGCQVLESATWSSNESARRAHDKLGFREIRVIYRKLVAP